MGRACSCCLPTKSSSSSSRDDSFYICVLGQVVDVGPLRSEKEVVVQAAWLHDNEELLCADDDSTQQITLTLSYNYSTEVMSYSYVFNCLKLDGTTANPAGGGGSGSGTFSIKPPLDTTIECHTEKLDLGGSLGAVWPWITCNDNIVNEDCVPVGGCQVILRNLCLKQIRDETFCDKAGGPDVPWGDDAWFGTFDFADNPTGQPYIHHGTFYPKIEFERHTGDWGQTWGCGGCLREKRCQIGSWGMSVYYWIDDFFNWFTPTDWDNDKFLDIVAIVYGIPGRDSTSAGQNIMLPYYITYGTDVKMGYDPEPCYEDLKIRGPCNHPFESGTAKEEYCKHLCETNPNYSCDCMGQLNRFSAMRETCNCTYVDPYGGGYYEYGYEHAPCQGKPFGHKYGCGTIDIGELFYTKYPGYDTFRIKMACRVGYWGPVGWTQGWAPGPGYISYYDCRYFPHKAPLPSNVADIDQFQQTTGCSYNGWAHCIELFDQDHPAKLQIRSANVGHCGGANNDRVEGGLGMRDRCSRAWYTGSAGQNYNFPGGPFAHYIYPPLYGRLMNYFDPNLGEHFDSTPYNRGPWPGSPIYGGYPVTPMRKTTILPSVRNLGSWDFEETIDENHNYAMYPQYGYNYSYDELGQNEEYNYGLIKVMGWEEFKTSSCVLGVHNEIRTPESDFFNKLKSAPTLDGFTGINFFAASWMWPCQTFNPWKMWWWYDLSTYMNNFFASWASSTGSDALCEGGSAPGGGGGNDPGDPLEIATWDDSPQNFSWTRFVEHSESDSVTGGTKPYEANIATGKLPQGLKAGISNSGKLSIDGMTEADAGAYLCTIQVVDQGGGSDFTDQITITVQDTDNPDGTIEFDKWNVSQSLINGEVNALYQALDKVIGGAAPYNKIEVITGSLPLGLSVFINDAGRVMIMGFPVEPGRSQFKLRATDSRENTGDSGTLTIDIWGTPNGGPGGGPGNPGPGDPEGIIAPGATVNYSGPTIIYPPQGSTSRSGLRFYVDQRPNSPNSMPSGLHLNEVTGAITGTFPTGEYGPRVLPLFCRVSGTPIPNSGFDFGLGFPSGSSMNFLSGVGLNEAGGGFLRIDKMIPIQFNMRSRILRPSGNIVSALGDSTTFWNSGDIQEGDFLLSIIADANGVPTVDLSSGWSMLIPSTGLPFPTGGGFRPSGEAFRTDYQKLLFPGLGHRTSGVFPSGLPSGQVPTFTGVLTPTGLWPTSYATVALYKIAGTGDAAYGTAHSQTVGAGLISSIGFRKPSGNMYNGNQTPTVIKYTHSQDSFEVNLERPTISSGINNISGVKLHPISGTPVAGSGTLFFPSIDSSIFYDRGNFIHSQAYEVAGLPPGSSLAQASGLTNWKQDISLSRQATSPGSGVSAIYIWTAKSTTPFQVSGPSGVNSEEFTLHRRGESAGNFPGFTNPLSMMIAVSQYSYVRPSSVSPFPGSPTGCNLLVLEI